MGTVPFFPFDQGPFVTQTSLSVRFSRMIAFPSLFLSQTFETLVIQSHRRPFGPRAR